MAVDQKRLTERQLQNWHAAAQRWRDRQGPRGDAKGKMEKREEADRADRVLAFARREAERPQSSPHLRSTIRAAMERPWGLQDKVSFIERRIGPTVDWSIVPSGLNADAAGRAVARLCSSPEAIQGVGFATGFLVSPALLLTNHHVFEDAGAAKGVYAHFGYEVHRGVTQTGTFFELAPERFFENDGHLDFALVAVKPQAYDGVKRLSHIRPLRLIAEVGKVLVGHPVAIIQHPNGGTKKYAERQNRLLDVLDEFLHYETDTMPGSSGSPCFSQAWEVIALHHTGVPRMEGGDIKAKGGGRWNQSMGEDQIDWVANEGVRVSGVVNHLTRLDLAGEKGALRDALFESRLWDADASLPFDEGSDDANEPTPKANNHQSPVEKHVGTTIIHVHGNPTFYVNCQITPGATAAVDNNGVPRFLEKKIRFDPNYANRRGYQPDFLGVDIPVPDVATGRLKQMLKGLDGRVVLLRYHHFSVAMNRTRRFQMWSAVNVDYSDAARRYADRREAFGTDTWIPDPRVPAALQVQDDEFYKPATNVDRGHVVRRDDNCWGHTEQETEFANSDTFHWTNCTPQHERFNQSRQSGLWGQLEDVVKEQAQNGPQRVSIFAGPVLTADDPDAYGIEYPVRFWKVIAAIVDGRLDAYGFVLDQSDVVARFGLEESLDFGKFKIKQLALAEIQSLTGVVFPAVLLSADTMSGQPSVDIDEAAKVRRRSVAVHAPAVNNELPAE